MKLYIHDISGPQRPNSFIEHVTLTGFIIMYVRSMAIVSELEVVLPLVEDGENAWAVAAANAAMMNPTFMCEVCACVSPLKSIHKESVMQQCAGEWSERKRMLVAELVGSVVTSVMFFN